MNFAEKCFEQGMRQGELEYTCNTKGDELLAQSLLIPTFSSTANHVLTLLSLSLSFLLLILSYHLSLRIKHSKNQKGDKQFL